MPGGNLSCSHQKGHRDKTQVESGKRVVTISYHDRKIGRNNLVTVVSDWGDAFSNVTTRSAVVTSAGRPTDGIHIP
ncbi:hypothetical protein Taro_006052 [Colocasia esculenta]|uniref:Uncharacterized protein n=1 Tax=Colocasia esculenta TaxID=4460 RepID=A0A843TU70_COLES|nr:hypothetical protein [Colocasia esculenta]